MNRMLTKGEVLAVGDRIVNGAGPARWWCTVTRVTKTRAYCRINEHAEACYRRQLNAWNEVVPVLKQGLWDTLIRRAYRRNPEC